MKNILKYVILNFILYSETCIRFLVITTLAPYMGQ